MSTNPCYNSRFCYCLWSQGDLKQAIVENHQNCLHHLWERKHFYIELENGKKRLSICRILRSTAAYPLGMAGYFADTLLKLLLLVGNSFLLLLSFCSKDKKWRHARKVFFIDNAAALGISLVGTLLPPLAYKLDKLAEEQMCRWIETGTPPSPSPVRQASFFHPVEKDEMSDVFATPPIGRAKQEPMRMHNRVRRRLFD